MTDEEVIAEYIKLGDNASYFHADDSCKDWTLASACTAKMRDLKAQHPNLTQRMDALRVSRGWML